MSEVNKAIVVILATAVGLAGCAPSYSVWEGAMEQRVGRNFNIYYNNPTGTFWAPLYSNREKRFADKIVDEQTWKRYYLTWMKQCKYSVLVDDKGIIRSWRYETDDRGSCYVW